MLRSQELGVLGVLAVQDHYSAAVQPGIGRRRVLEVPDLRVGKGGRQPAEPGHPGTARDHGDAPEVPGVSAGEADVLPHDVHGVARHLRQVEQQFELGPAPQFVVDGGLEFAEIRERKLGIDRHLEQVLVFLDDDHAGRSRDVKFPSAQAYTRSPGGGNSPFCSRA